MSESRSVLARFSLGPSITFSILGLVFAAAPLWLPYLVGFSLFELMSRRYFLIPLYVAALAASCWFSWFCSSILFQVLFRRGAAVTHCDGVIVHINAWILRVATDDVERISLVRRNDGGWLAIECRGGRTKHLSLGLLSGDREQLAESIASLLGHPLVARSTT